MRYLIMKEFKGGNIIYEYYDSDLLLEPIECVIKLNSSGELTNKVNIVSNRDSLPNAGILEDLISLPKNRNNIDKLTRNIKFDYYTSEEDALEYEVPVYYKAIGPQYIYKVLSNRGMYRTIDVKLKGVKFRFTISDSSLVKCSSDFMFWNTSPVMLLILRAAEAKLRWIGGGNSDISLICKSNKLRGVR